MGVTVVKRLPKYGEGMKGAAAKAMPRIAEYLRSQADKKIRNGVPPANAPLTQAVKQGSQTLRDSGALAASITAHNGKDWAAAGTNLRYAKRLQEGGVIRGKAKGLWIPAGSETRRIMRSYGATGAGKLIARMKADGWEMWRRGKAFLAKKEKGSAFVLFIIKQQVEIPARPFLYIDAKEEKFILRTIENAIAETLGGK